MTEHDPNAPWVPEGLAAKLVVGARVRWRKNPECSFRCEGCGADLHDHYPETGEGIIAGLPNSPNVKHGLESKGECAHISPHQGHDFGIRADIRNYEYGRGFWAAAIELVPITEEETEKAT